MSVKSRSNDRTHTSTSFHFEIHLNKNAWSRDIAWLLLRCSDCSISYFFLQILVDFRFCSFRLLQCTRTYCLNSELLGRTRTRTYSNSDFRYDRFLLGLKPILPRFDSMIPDLKQIPPRFESDSSQTSIHISRFDPDSCQI